MIVYILLFWMFILSIVSLSIFILFAKYIVRKNRTGLIGPRGLNGSKGKDGLTGPSGETGEKGDKGEKGETGPTGLNGEKGEKGDTGSTGPLGPTGATQLANLQVGNLLYLDSTYGNDSNAQKNLFDYPFSTFEAANSVATTSDQIIVRPGQYILSTGYTLSTGISVKGSGPYSTIFKIENATTSTSLFTMNDNTSISDLGIVLDSQTSNSVTLSGITFPNSTNTNSQINNLAITVNKSQDSTSSQSDTYGILVQCTSTGSDRFVNVNDCVVNVYGSGNGRKCAVYMDTGYTGAIFHIQNGSFLSTQMIGASTRANYEGCESNSLFTNLCLRGSYMGYSLLDTGATNTGADISQTLGTIQILNGVGLKNSNANGKGFTTLAGSGIHILHLASCTAAGTAATRFIPIGFNSTTFPASTTESPVRTLITKPTLLKNLAIQWSGSPGISSSAVFTVRKNGVNTSLTVTVATATISPVQTQNVSVNFASGDYLSLSIVASGANISSFTGWVLTVEEL